MGCGLNQNNTIVVKIIAHVFEFVYLTIGWNNFRIKRGIIERIILLSGLSENPECLIGQSRLVNLI